VMQTVWKADFLSGNRFLGLKSLLKLIPTKKSPRN
jgi:hypothetical protein